LVKAVAFNQQDAAEALAGMGDDVRDVTREVTLGQVLSCKS